MFPKIYHATSALRHCRATLFAKTTKRSMAVAISNSLSPEDYRRPKLWPFGIVPYNIQEGGFDQEQQSCIRQAIDRFNQPDLNVTLIPRSHESHYIQFQAGDGDKPAFVGRSDASIIYPQAVFCGADNPDFGYPSMLRQIMHVLGFHLEHRRPDRDRFIHIVGGYGYFYRRDYAKKLTPGGVTLLGDYDINSIMHDPTNDFGFCTRNGDKVRTMVYGNHGVQEGQQASGLSELDIQGINQVYPAVSEITPQESALLGREWDVIERGEKYTWVRCGNTRIFEAKGLRHGSRMRGILCINIDPETYKVSAIQMRTEPMNMQQQNFPQQNYTGILSHKTGEIFGECQGENGQDTKPWRVMLRPILAYEENNAPSAVGCGH